MSSRHRSRSSSGDRNGDTQERDHKRSSDLPHKAEPISEADYFLKSTEFRKWLKDEKDRFFDELSGEKSRSYFRKFVKAWNRGKLSGSYYVGIDPASQPAAALTGYKWSFVEKRSRNEQNAIEEARHLVGAATYGANPDATRKPQAGPSRPSGGRAQAQGPTLPSHSDLVLMREAGDEHRASERSYERKRARAEEKERIEDLAGPKERGREGMLEKKRAKREDDRAARDARDDPIGEFDESTLMGGGDSFKARIAQRDAARKRFEEKRGSTREDKVSAVRERQEAIREKDKATMEMFKQMAKQRFG